VIQSARLIPEAGERASAEGAGGAGAARVWGLSCEELHDRRWASAAVEVVRPGQSRAVSRSGPALYLLLERDQLALFELAPIARRMAWLKPSLVRVRLRNRRSARYRERVDEAGGEFRGVSRRYGRASAPAARAVVTPSASMAAAWASSADARSAWREVSRGVPEERLAVWRSPASVYDGSSEAEADAFLRDLQTEWGAPDSVIDGVYEFQRGVWLHETVVMRSSVRFVGPVWVGAGVHLPAGSLVVGPCRIGDDPRLEVESRAPAWEDIERDSRLISRRRLRGSRRRPGKRLFDIGFSLAVIACTLPLYPVVALIIMLEDGWPPFFAHRRQTLRGREFPCLKFRTMRKDAERMKARLEAQNQADGPQFFIENDPRLLRCGRLLRKFQIDELPQFLNVLAGHMSVVGPRPSPDKENQYCPAWREARLSVRPGVTGLWQVRRTREPETDFQEWIRYDLEYVRRQSYRLDLWIIVQTVLRLVKG